MFYYRIVFPHNVSIIMDNAMDPTADNSNSNGENNNNDGYGTNKGNGKKRQL